MHAHAWVQPRVHEVGQEVGDHHEQGAGDGDARDDRQVGVAQRRVYGLRAGPLSEIDAWLEPYRRYWSGRLDALERHLDESP